MSINTLLIVSQQLRLIVGIPQETTQVTLEKFDSRGCLPLRLQGEDEPLYQGRQGQLGLLFPISISGPAEIYFLRAAKTELCPSFARLEAGAQ